MRQATKTWTLRGIVGGVPVLAIVGWVFLQWWGWFNGKMDDIDRLHQENRELRSEVKVLRERLDRVEASQDKVEDEMWVALSRQREHIYNLDVKSGIMREIVDHYITKQAVRAVAAAAVKEPEDEDEPKPTRNDLDKLLDDVDRARKGVDPDEYKRIIQTEQRALPPQQKK